MASCLVPSRLRPPWQGALLPKRIDSIAVISTQSSEISAKGLCFKAPASLLSDKGVAGICRNQGVLMRDTDAA